MRYTKALVILLFISILKGKVLDYPARVISIPQLINYQGRLTNLAGAPVVDSIYSITFRLFTVPTGGVAFWSETQNVQTNQGLFNVYLGAVVPIESIPSAGNCYLEMQVNPYPAMTPRIRLTSAPYTYLSKKSDTANYALSANILYVDSARVSSDAHKLQGKDTLDLSNKFVDEGEANAISTTMLIDGAVTNPKLASNSVSTDKIQNDAITSEKIQDGTITRSDVGSSFKAPYADTADYVRYLNVSYVDSARVSSNAHRLQGKDTLALSAKFVDEGQPDAITTIMIANNAITQLKIQDGAVTNTKLSSNAVTSDKIQDGTILRQDVAPIFKAPYADTSDYARNVNVIYVDSARVSSNAHQLQGKDTLALSAKFVDENQPNSISSVMIIDGTISRSDVTPNFKAPYSDTADYVRYLPGSIDSARVAAIAYNAYKLQGKDTVDFDYRYVNEGQTAAITNSMISNNAVTSEKIQDGAVTNPKLADNSVSTDKIQNNAITSEKIQDGTIQAVDLAFQPATRPLVPGVDNSEIQDNAITSNKIQDHTILGQDISVPLNLTGTVNWPNGVLQIKNSGVGSGLTIDSAGFGGVRINYTFGDGINIGYAAQTGLAIDTVGGSAIRIISPTFDGIGIDDAGFAGLYAMHIGDNGVQIDSAEGYGVYAHGNMAGGNFVAAGPSAYGLEVYSYEANPTDTALVVYGQGYATGGWYTSGLANKKSAPCVISPELSIITSGTGMLSGNEAEITLPIDFVENIREDIPIRIVLTPHGRVGAFLYIAEVKKASFKVAVEEIPGLNRSTEPVRFDWIALGYLKAPKADYAVKWQKLIKDREVKKKIRAGR